MHTVVRRVLDIQMKEKSFMHLFIKLSYIYSYIYLS